MHLIKTRCSGFDESRTKKGGQQRLSSTTQWTLSLRNAKPRPTSKQRLSNSRNANARESPLRVPQTQLAFHPRAERNVSVIAVCIGNPYYSPLASHCRSAAPTPIGFAEIVSDCLPIIHARFHSRV